VNVPDEEAARAAQPSASSCSVRHPAFTNRSQDVAVTVALWWCFAIALNFLGAVLLTRAIAVLGAANPSSLLPWVGRAATVPGTVLALQILALGSASLAMTCVTEALGRKHLYDALWDLPFLAAGLGAALAVQVRHNRRVRHGIYVGRET
jgi:hypothetical protein